MIRKIDAIQPLASSPSDPILDRRQGHVKSSGNLPHRDTSAHRRHHFSAPLFGSRFLSSVGLLCAGKNRNNQNNSITRDRELLTVK